MRYKEKEERNTDSMVWERGHRAILGNPAQKTETNGPWQQMEESEGKIGEAVPWNEKEQRPASGSEGIRNGG